jgi:ABC-type amino acid transport substrate-binding protein
VERKKSVGYGATIFFIVVIWLGVGSLIVKTTSYTVAVVAGTTYEEKAHEFNRAKIFDHYQDERQIFHELATGQVEVAITDRLTGLSLIRDSGYRNLKLAGNVLEREVGVVAFNREDKTLRQAVNRGLKEIIDSGVYAGISTKYFGCDILKGVEYNPTYPDEPPATDDSWSRVKQAGRIVFTMNSDFPPFAYFNDQSEFTGFDVEVAQAVCERLGLRYTPVIIEWDQTFEGLKVKNYDGVWGCLLMKDKPVQVDYSNPYYLTGAQLFVRKGSPITGLETLEGNLRVPLSFPLNFKSYFSVYFGYKKEL